MSISVERLQWPVLFKIWWTYIVNRKKTRYTQFTKITEQLRSYQVQKDILVDEQFSHDFFKLSLFPFRNYQWNGEGTHGRLLRIRFV